MSCLLAITHHSARGQAAWVVEYDRLQQREEMTPMADHPDALPELSDEEELQLETTDGVWIRPDDALARFERGEFPLVFATIHQLRALSGLAGVAAAHQRFVGVPPLIGPRVVRRDGRDVILLPDEE
jgi:hypothetical protein